MTPLFFVLTLIAGACLGAAVAVAAFWLAAVRELAGTADTTTKE